MFRLERLDRFDVTASGALISLVAAELLIETKRVWRLGELNESLREDVSSLGEVVTDGFLGRLLDVGGSLRDEFREVISSFRGDAAR